MYLILNPLLISQPWPRSRNRWFLLLYCLDWTLKMSSMFSPFSYSELFTGVVQDGRIDDEILKRKDLGPSLAYSLSAVLSFPGLIPFVNEEDFRSPLGTTRLALRHKSIRFGVDLGCNPPLFDVATAWLCFLLSKILSSVVLSLRFIRVFWCIFTIIYIYYSRKHLLCQFNRCLSNSCINQGKVCLQSVARRRSISVKKS